MAVNHNEDTELQVIIFSNDALRKHGIIPPREHTPPPPSPPSPSKLETILIDASPSELQELEDDSVDSDTERMIAAYRHQRLAELRKSQRDAKFGEVYPISREDYKREVTDASTMDVPGESPVKGTGVVCFLYKDGQPASTRLAAQLKELARRHPTTKFVSIVGDKCIPNYADDLCPTLIVYRGGNVTRQEVAWGNNKERSIAELEAILILSLAITSAPHPPTSDDPDLDGSESEEDVRVRLSKPRASASTQTKAQRNLRSTSQEDSDSDFDL